MPNDLGAHRPTTDQTIPLVRRLYEHDCVGGPLHIVLDDGNLEDDHIQYCLDSMAENDISKEVEALCTEIANAMLQMTMTQRREVYNNAGE